MVSFEPDKFQELKNILKTPVRGEKNVFFWKSFEKGVLGNEKS